MNKTRTPLEPDNRPVCHLERSWNYSLAGSRPDFPRIHPHPRIESRPIHGDTLTLGPHSIRPHFGAISKHLIQPPLLPSGAERSCSRDPEPRRPSSALAVAAG